MHGESEALIPYPSGTDAGNGARQMQDMAERIETELADIDAGWDLARSPAGWVARSLSTWPLGQTTLVQWLLLSNPSTVAIDYDPFSQGRSQRLSGNSARWELWDVGLYMPVTAAATLTVGGRVEAAMLIRDRDPVTEVINSTWFRNSTVISSTTVGEFVMVTGLARVRNAVISYYGQATASAPATAAAGALAWAIRVGEE